MALEYTVLRMQRDLEDPFSENAKAASGSAPCTTGSAYDDQSTLVQWIDQLATVSTSV